MLNWVKDVLGINRYSVAWNIDFGGRAYQGDSVTTYEQGTMSLLSAKHIVTKLNKEYGAGSHWPQIVSVQR